MVDSSMNFVSPRETFIAVVYLSRVFNNTQGHIDILHTNNQLYPCTYYFDSFNVSHNVVWHTYFSNSFHRNNYIISWIFPFFISRSFVRVGPFNMSQVKNLSHTHTEQFWQVSSPITPIHIITYHHCVTCHCHLCH